MASCTIAIRCDAASVQSDLALLTQAAKGSLQLRQRLLDLGNLGSHLRCVDADPALALDACEFGIRFEFSDALAQLVSAVRAGQFDGLVVQDVFHG